MLTKLLYVAALVIFTVTTAKSYLNNEGADQIGMQASTLLFLILIGAVYRVLTKKPTSSPHA